MKTFAETEAEYFRLKGQLTTGRITPAQFNAALQSLMVQDAQGRYWTLGPDTGKWYVSDGNSWMEAQPPLDAPQKSSCVPLVGLGLFALVLLIGVVVAFVFFKPANLPIANAPTQVSFVATLPLLPTLTTASMRSPVATEAPTAVLPIDTPLPLRPIVPTNPPATATVVLPTIAPATNTPVPQSPTPAIAPGLYITALRLEPSPPKHNQDIGFYPAFLNTTSATQNFRWLVYIYRPSNLRHSVGETPAGVTAIPTGASEQRAFGTWKISGGGCEDFLARVVWLDDNRQPTIFAKPGGEPFEQYFTMCD